MYTYKIWSENDINDVKEIQSSSEEEEEEGRYWTIFTHVK